MADPNRIRIVHVSSGLGAGGAETMLYRLLQATDRDRFEPAVVSLGDRGVIGPRIEELGVPVHALGMRRGRFGLDGLWSLSRLLRRLDVQVVQTWMYHADLIGGLAARLAGGVPVCWGVHHTILEPGQSRASTRFVARACRWTSRTLPRRIVCCSEASLRTHREAGYPEDRMIVIQNGFDLEMFAPDATKRAEVRAELDIPPQAPVIGLVARFEPPKDHRNFVTAAGILAQSLPDAVFVLCGIGVDDRNRQLAGWIAEEGLEGSFRLLGRRSDVPRILAALDVSGTSSLGEAFPLVVGEAMACGVPCVVTDVGDSAAIVGPTGRVVAPRDPAALAAAWGDLLTMDPARRRELGAAARRRILDNYEISSVARRYEQVQFEALSGRSG